MREWGVKNWRKFITVIGSSFHLVLCRDDDDDDDDDNDDDDNDDDVDDDDGDDSNGWKLPLLDDRPLVFIKRS